MLSNVACLSVVLINLILLQRSQGSIARTRSEPVDSQEKIIRKMDKFFRIIPSTPGAKEIKEWLKTSAEKDTGIKSNNIKADCFQIYMLSLTQLKSLSWFRK